MTKKKDRSVTANFVKDSRRKLDLTQRELALRIGKKRTDIVKYERGITTPPGDVVLEIHRLVDNDIQL